MSILLDMVYLALLAVAWPLLLYRRWRRGPGSLSLRERLGNAPVRPVSAKCVWLHAVSLGEVNATRTLVEELRRRSPETVIAVSATTQTGLERARALYPKLTVFRFPLDLSFIVRRAMRRIRPSVIVLMELEVWPNLVEVASRHGVPVIIANGRVTHEKSVRCFNWPLLRQVSRRMFSKLRWVGAQDETYARRFSGLGVPPERIEITGSLKYDAADVADWIEGQEALADETGINRRRPLWVCGSTGPGEEAAVLDAYSELLRSHPELQLAIVPRKPERFDEVAALIVQRGFACLRRSGGPPVVPSTAEPRPVFLGDTMGELRRFYGLATVVFVGRTLAPMGGSDVMEVAGLARAMVLGPHTENFAEATALLRAEGGCVEVSRAEELAGAVRRLLEDAAGRERIGQAARRAIVRRRGATGRTVERIIALIEDA
ncbi:MAG: 3-deoxy-D-manno-octulosonic acid transferase [Phycisphaerae bacterium]|nr:3-deoxy-D-manno-octulosonic acid transferase [Phycisphaerae bacterium]MCZ2398712.1 3-deoxy-D-manno-octulosonic acid transferase [Phycisphaerae bacterium]